MAENSWHWGGTAVGDAGTYDNDTDWSDIMRKLMASWRASEGIVARYANGLEVTNPAGQTIRVATGMAIVDGKFYESDANEDTLLVAPGAGTDYYSMVLRKAFAAQTVRQTLVGPINGGPAPAPTQTDGVTWDLPLAEVRITNVGVVTVLDERRPAHTGLAGQVLLEEKILTAAVASVTFSGIPGFFRHLRIVGQARVTTAVTSAACNVRFNGDAGNNYDSIGSREQDVSTLTTFESLAGNAALFAYIVGASGPADAGDVFTIDIPNYAGEIFQKGFVSASSEKDGIAAGNVRLFAAAGWWRNTAIINSITLLPAPAAQWEIGTTISLYGIP